MLYTILTRGEEEEEETKRRCCASSYFCIQLANEQLIRFLLDVGLVYCYSTSAIWVMHVFGLILNIQYSKKYIHILIGRCNVPTDIFIGFITYRSFFIVHSTSTVVAVVVVVVAEFKIFPYGACVAVFTMRYWYIPCGTIDGRECMCV